MKASVKSSIRALLAVVAAQVVDYVWYSGFLPWQSEVSRDFAMVIITNIVLAVASCLFYGAFYDGTDIRDILEFALVFTIMHLALSGTSSPGGLSDIVNLLIDGAHSFVVLFVIVFIEHQMKKLKSGKKFK